MKTSVSRVLVALSVVGALCMNDAAEAVPITYTFEGIASGALQGVAFTDVTLRFDVFSDTTAPIGGNASTKVVENATGAVTLQGLGTLAFQSPGALFSNKSFGPVGGQYGVGLNGFGATTSGTDIDIMGAFGPGFDNFVYNTPVSPTAAGTYLPYYQGKPQFWRVPTSGGRLTVTEVTDMTFSATVTAVPEPATAFLLALGLAGIGLMARKGSAKPR